MNMKCVRFIFRINTKIFLEKQKNTKLKTVVFIKTFKTSKAVV